MLYQFSRVSRVAILVFLSLSMLSACEWSAEPEAESKAQSTSSSPSPYTGKKILFVNSYHAGYEWSDGIEQGLNEALDGKGIDLKLVRMDTKRNTDDAFRKDAALKAKAEIEAFQPDVVIAADDNAQKYLVVPYFKGTELPVIFNGVNWDAGIYGYPAPNVTGMVEVEMPLILLERLKQYAAGKRVGYITVDSTTERKVVEIYNEKFFRGKLDVFFVKNWEDFKKVFVASQKEVDVLILGTNAGIDQWDDETVRAFMTENTRIPTGTLYTWLAPYVLLTHAKRPEEQGEWAGETALRILDGTAVSDIPVVTNRTGKWVVNLDIAERLGVTFSPTLMKIAETYSASKQ